MNRNAVWEPVGIDITGSKTVEEALKRAELDFTVDRKFLYDEYGNQIPGYFRNVRSDNGNVLGIVTPKYKILQNDTAFEFINNLVSEGLEFERGGVFHNGSAVWVEAKLPGDYSILGDEVESHVMFVNSHNGKGSVRVCALPNRVVCSNQINLAVKNAQRAWSAVHSTKIDGRLEEAAATLGFADTYMKANKAFCEDLARKRFTLKDFNNILDLAFPVDKDKDSNRKQTNVNAVKSGIIQCYEADDIANLKDTALGAVYALTDYFDHSDAQRNTSCFLDARLEQVTNGHPKVDDLVAKIVAA